MVSTFLILKPLNFVLEPWFFILKNLLFHRNLDNVLEQSTITENTALKYFQGMVKGLDHIHGKKIIHGDLSRKNIFIDANNVIKVADFGLGIGFLFKLINF